VITIRPRTHAYKLIQLLSVAGEIPPGALSLLGSERVFDNLVHKLELSQNFRFDKDGQVYHTKLIQVSGRKDTRTIRLYKKAVDVLDELTPGLLKWYMAAFNNHIFSGDTQHIQRNHRVAEVLTLCMAAGIEIRPYALPALKKIGFGMIVPGAPSFYIARDLKKAGIGEDNKTTYTRLTGALFYPGGCYAVYNTRGSVMKWSGVGEVKTAVNLQELARINAGLDETKPALLLGYDPGTAFKTMLESDKSRRAEFRFDRVYPKIHFIPLNQYGIRLLKILATPDWNEKLLTALFEPEQRSYNRASMEYDAMIDNRMILSHLDSDIARLYRFRESLANRVSGSETAGADVICYPWQTDFLKSYLGDLAGLRELEMDSVESVL